MKKWVILLSFLQITDGCCALPLLWTEKAEICEKGRLILEPRYTFEKERERHTVSISCFYGVSENITLSAHLPYIVAKERGMGDVKLSAEHLFVKEKRASPAITLGLRLHLPTGDDTAEWRLGLSEAFSKRFSSISCHLSCEYLFVGEGKSDTVFLALSVCDPQTAKATIIYEANYVGEKDTDTLFFGPALIYEPDHRTEIGVGVQADVGNSHNIRTSFSIKKDLGDRR